jgi:hypothetical protein
MPVCPKCHKLISAARYSRHLRRCGVKHKRVPDSIRVHGYSDIYFTKNDDYGKL